MTWKETNAMEERMKFIVDYRRKEDSLSALCEAYGISRPTGYKWIKRYEEEGPRGLEERSRAPHTPILAVSKEMEKEVLEMRKRFPSFGPKKLRVQLEKKDGAKNWPATSTIGEILQRNNAIVSRRTKDHSKPRGEALTPIDEVNRVWSADFKGDFRTGDGQRCVPLTISEGFSRYLLLCQGLQETNGEWVRMIFDRIFREYGLPEVIRTDNGPPFASVGIGGLTRLAVWWIKLGIYPERIQPGRPQQNGRHERLHRTLKEETASPPARTLRAQQKRFDRFQKMYNEERPHESLGQRPPAQLFHPSSRAYSGKAPDWEYPETMSVRRVKTHGEISWQGKHWYVGECLGGEWVGLEESEEKGWRISLGHVILGTLDASKGEVVREPYLRRNTPPEDKPASHPAVCPR